MDVILQLLGRLHPLIVHLPIGFLVLGLIFAWRDRKSHTYTHLIATIFLWAGFVSVMACLSGLLLYQNEGYAYASVMGHLWFGVATAFFCFVLYFRFKGTFIGFLQKLSPTLLIFLGLILISVTGHKGGNLTHGEDYLVEPLPNGFKKALGLPVLEQMPIELTKNNWETAALYEEVVHPILNNKCAGCHGPKQDKGGLRLHSAQDLLRGGENGKVLIEQQPDRSELFVRIALPKEDEGHMPPKDKEQLTKEEMAIIRAWIEIGHPFEGSIGAHKMAQKLFEPFFPKEAAEYYPRATLPALSADSLTMAKAAGLHVEHLSKDLPWLIASAINKPEFTSNDVHILDPLASYVVDLDLSNTQINDGIYQKLTFFPHLTKLKLSHTKISVQGIEALSALVHLKQLNLTYTEVGPGLLEKLESFPALEQVFLYGTQLPSDGPKSLRNGALRLDYGGYFLPPRESDSIIY